MYLQISYHCNNVVFICKQCFRADSEQVALMTLEDYIYFGSTTIAVIVIYIYTNTFTDIKHREECCKVTESVCHK